MKTIWPLRWEKFWPQGHNLNKIVWGLPDNATYQYQGSVPSGLLKFSFQKSISAHLIAAKFGQIHSVV